MRTAIVVRCPALKSYTAAEQKQLAYELRGLTPGSKLAGAVADYGTLRKRCRAVEKPPAK